MLINIGWGTVMGYLLMATATLSFWFYRMDWFQDGFMGTLWAAAPFVFALGAAIIISRITMDPKFIIGGAAGAGMFYWLFFVMA
jgi:hypothetical protein